MCNALELHDVLPLRTWKIRICKPVSLSEARTLNPGEVHTVSAHSTLSGPSFNGALFAIKNYPHHKFLWHDEFEVLEEVI